ncbi:MAG: hypothetical protein K9M99_06735 [Candidatus Cloacimonetes bacterium]|nr:hypothetical protein [Candidatus Cloacimonadota bacterium]
MKKILYSFFLIALIVGGCDLSSPEEASTGEIANALDALELAFNLHHIDEIMVFYANSYLHNGDDIDDVLLDWEIRLNDFQEMELSDIVIELDGDRATVTCRRIFYVNGASVQEWNEPEDNGDISYWSLVGDQWLIRGNEHIREDR